MKTIISIDPGKSGGIAVYYAPEGNVVAEPMPKTEGDLVEPIRFIQMHADHAQVVTTQIVCYVEKVGGFIKGNKAPGSTMFNFGFGCGVIEGALRALGIKTVYVRPQTWQKYFSLGTASGCATKTIWKAKLKSEAQRRYPQLKVTLATADALLILAYAQAQERQ